MFSAVNVNRRVPEKLESTQRKNRLQNAVILSRVIIHLEKLRRANKDHEKGTAETKKKYQQVVKQLTKNTCTYKEVAKLCASSKNTVIKVKKTWKQLEKNSHILNYGLQKFAKNSLK